MTKYFVSGKKTPSNPNVPKMYRFRKVCKQHGCKLRVKKDSTRVFCYRHDSQWMVGGNSRIDNAFKSLEKVGMVDNQLTSAEKISLAHEQELYDCVRTIRNEKTRAEMAEKNARRRSEQIKELREWNDTLREKLVSSEAYIIKQAMNIGDLADYIDGTLDELDSAQKFLKYNVVSFVVDDPKNVPTILNNSDGTLFEEGEIVETSNLSDENAFITGADFVPFSI